MHNTKRFYLICALVLSYAIPLITFTSYVEVVPILDTFVPSELFFEPQNNVVTTSITSTNYLPFILWSVYGIVTLFLAVKFMVNIYKMIDKINSNPKQHSNNITNVLVQEKITPYTFFSYLFFNKQQFENQQIPKEVYVHEQTHAIQKHSLDILFIELIFIFFWFNPVVYLLKHAIKLNHEFLADQAVLRNGFKLSAYQNILLSFMSNNKQPVLANAINYSSIKKRFTIMKTKTSKNIILFKTLALLPLIAILLYSFSQKVVVEKDVSPAEVVKLKIANTDGASETMMNEYNNFIKKVEKSHIINGSEYKRIVAIYDLMSEEQKKSVTKYPKGLNLNLSKTSKKQPTVSEFNSWKDSSKFAIWIDGRHVANSQLDNYSINEIVYFSGSFVYKNARSEKFPQAHQFHLYTEKGFEKNYTKANLTKYNSLLNTYSKKLNSYLKTNSTNNDELRILKVRLDNLYLKFSKEELNKWHIKRVTPVPSGTIPPPPGNQKTKIATQEMVEKYNKWAHKINENPNSIIKLKDFNRMEAIYSLMSQKQKNKAEKFPKIPQVIPRPAKEKIKKQKSKKILSSKIDTIKSTASKLDTREQVIEYNKLLDLSSPEVHYTKQTFWVNNKKGKKIANKYYELSKYYKRKWLRFPPNIYTKKQISKEEFQKLTDASMYVVRIDGIVIDNNKLKKYKNTDFVTFSSVDISKYAELPQNHHYNLITESGYKILLILKKSRSKQDHLTKL